MLNAEERQRLESLAHRSHSAPPVARRARIILACADGRATTSVAKRLHLSATTVCKWRTRFLRDRVDGLYDEPRPGTPRRITDERIEQVIIRTLESTPRGATQWSTRGMAKATGLSNATISRIWRAFGLQPHRTKTFKLSKDPLLIDNVRDIVGL
jgi:transposase